MEFFKCSIGGETYGTGVTEIEMSGARRNGIILEEVSELQSVNTDLSIIIRI